MDFISIRTPQNVVISYPLASVIQRVIAYVIDLIVLWLSIWLFVFVTDSSGGETFIVLMFAYILFFNLIFEAFLGGKTVGKSIIGIRVLKVDGSKPKFSDIFLRWVFRAFDFILSSGILSVLMVNLTEQRQRFGDVMAGTTVVSNKTSDRRLDISTIDKKYQGGEYKQKFALIKSFNEDEMVLIKNCLYRYGRHKNKAHKEVFEDMVKRIVKRLQLTKLPQNKEKFVREVIKDYVLANR